MEHVKWLFFILLAAVVAVLILFCGIQYAGWSNAPQAEISVEIIDQEPAAESGQAVSAPVKGEGEEQIKTAGATE